MPQQQTQPPMNQQKNVRQPPQPAPPRVNMGGNAQPPQPVGRPGMNAQAQPAAVGGPQQNFPGGPPPAQPQLLKARSNNLDSSMSHSFGYGPPKQAEPQPIAPPQNQNQPVM